MDLGEIYGLDRIIGHFFLTSHEIQHSAEYRYEYYFPHNCSVYLCKNRIGVGKQISEMYVFISILSGKENFFDKGRKNRRDLRLLTGTLLSGCAGCAYLLSYQESRFVSFRSFNRLERTLIWKL